jgi:hypothetical protein
MDKDFVHPASYRSAPLDSKEQIEEYIENTANRVCEHRCRKLKGEGGCLKIKNGKKICTGGFPKTVREFTMLVYEKKVRKGKNGK